ncbi:hypothetical protein N9Z32_05840 [Akkermansiaceae bacterium]|nr:hypothetical protein [Akkermansiaceae bacterium]MDB4755170.1 hypothetical protein [Akkermansiaceae bacterium]
MAEALFESECLGVEHAVNNEVFYGKSRGENPRDFGGGNREALYYSVFKYQIGYHLKTKDSPMCTCNKDEPNIYKPKSPAGFGVLIILILIGLNVTALASGGPLDSF